MIETLAVEESIASMVAEQALNDRECREEVERELKEKVTYEDAVEAELVADLGRQLLNIGIDNSNSSSSYYYSYHPHLDDGVTTTTATATCADQRGMMCSSLPALTCHHQRSRYPMQHRRVCAICCRTCAVCVHQGSLFFAFFVFLFHLLAIL